MGGECGRRGGCASAGEQFGGLASDACSSPQGHGTFPPTHAELFCSWDRDHCGNVDPRRRARGGPLPTGTVAFDASSSQKEEPQAQGSCASGGGFMKNLLVKGQGASPSLFCSAPAGRKE